MRERLENQLLAELSRQNINYITHFAEENPEAIEHLVALTFSSEEKLSMRASWTLEKLSERHPGILDEELPSLIKFLENVPFSSTRRTLSKVLMFHEIPEAYEGMLLDFCISMLESPKEPVAVKANCMTIIFNLLPKYPDLKNELFAIIEDQIPNNSAGFGARYKVLRKKFR